MNTVQRKFIIDKLTEKTKLRIDILKKSVPELLSLNVNMLHQVMSNDFEIKNTEELKKLILEKALKAGSDKGIREDWLGNSWNSGNRIGVHFTFDEFFIIPEKYIKLREEREAIVTSINKEIGELQLQLETLEVRIMVASDKTLSTLINEVDDMGSISLIDTRLKMLS
jgi:hypothetical protein